MDRVLTSEIWSEVKRRARTAKTRKAAIAYVTKDLIGLQSGDILITDASERSIRSGQTNAQLLRKLIAEGVVIHSHGGLHCKIVLLDKVAAIGSANMSGSGLIETSVITDNPNIRSGIASFIAQLSTRRSRLTSRDAEALCKIKVVRIGWTNFSHRSRAKKIRRLGDTTWIVGVNALLRSPTQSEQKYIDRATRDLNKRLETDEDDYNWIRWGKKDRFAKECRAGDTLIEITNNKKSKRRYVTRHIPVLLKRNEPTCTRFYVGQPSQGTDQINWSRFQRILKEAGHPRRVRPYSVQPLEPEMAKIINRKWTRVR